MLLLGATSAAAGTLTYPGAAPCNTTLQACVQGAARGDRIEIATAVAIDETISIRKSVTLTGASGVTPVIGASSTTRPVRIETFDDAPLSVSLRGLTLSNALILVLLSAGGGHRIEIADCGVSSTAGAAGLLVQAGAPAEIVVRNSDFAAGAYVVNFFSVQPAGDVVFTMLGNRIAASTSGYDGLYLDLRGAGTTTVNLWSNVVRDVTVRGVLLVALETARGTVNVVNNTIDRADGGFFIRTPGVGSTLAVNLFNNVVTHSRGAYSPGAALEVEAASPRLTITAGFNDFFANAGADVLKGYSLSSPLFALDPQFVDGPGSDYRLKPASLLVDAGTNAPPGGLPPIDAAGNQRVAGGIVDVGAFEFGSSPPTTTTTTITTTPPTTTTTTTTLACQRVASFEAILCRLDELAAAVQGGVPSGPLRDGLLVAVGQAKARTLDASTVGRPGPTKRSTRRALHALATFRARLRSRRAKQLDASVRESLLARAADVARDLKVGRR